MSRNIIIRGEAGCAPTCGHFMIAHTERGFVCGVELTNLGRTAVEGRYPLHFHVPGTAPELVAKDNALHHNHNRGVVMHAVNNMTVESNLCFRTKGHCFMTEDGGEQYNLVRNNVGVLPDPLDFGCENSHEVHDPNFTCAQRSEDRGANAFWVSNPNNFYDGNVGIAVGNAFFMETRHVRGVTRRLFPQEAAKVGRNFNIKSEVPLAQFTNNVAHSSGMGMGNYPRVYFPPGGRNAYENFTAWRCNIGLSVHNSRRQHVLVIGARLIQNRAGTRTGSSSDAAMAVNESQISAFPGGGPLSMPLITDDFDQTTETTLQALYRVDDYTKKWIRCHGNYEGLPPMFSGYASECAA